jgi:hypothetical protein
VDVSWKEVNSKKSNRNSHAISTPRKQAKMNRYQPSKPVPATNSFAGFEKELDNASINDRIRKITKSRPIFVVRVNNFSSLSQLLKEVAIGEYEIEIINKQIKIQPKSSAAYVNIVEKLKSKNIEFYIYKLKQERSFKIVLKHIHAIANLNNIKKEIEDVGHTVTNMWNIKKQGRKRPFT